MAQGNLREKLEELEKKYEGRLDVLERALAGVKRPPARGNLPLATDLVDLGNVPSCGMHKEGDQAIGTGAWTKVTLGTVTYDTDQMADVTNTCITVRRAGLYLVTGTVSWEAVAAGTVRATALLKGSIWFGRASTSGHGVISPGNNVSRPRYFNSGDKIFLYVYHDRGANLNIMGSTATQNGPCLEATLLADVGDIRTEMA